MNSPKQTVCGLRPKQQIAASIVPTAPDLAGQHVVPIGMRLRFVVQVHLDGAMKNDVPTTLR